MSKLINLTPLKFLLPLKVGRAWSKSLRFSRPIIRVIYHQAWPIGWRCFSEIKEHFGKTVGPY